ncbi:uncharacterized protein LOC131040480 [Cryptomeria japonica]|uniref:uncharacterized protein LOC131040480 n=1 Tax=Cryptomeria japonica TaxID=3369 RepID=UPI0027DA45A7|nr:uncharacterized protein LOC131040480 [Cryptomeria japonica]
MLKLPVNMRFLSIIFSIALLASALVLLGDSLGGYGFVWKGQLLKRDDTPKVFELHSGKVHMKITNWGATILSLSIPDSKGKLADVVLGFDTLTPYMNGSSPYFGALVGRVANRIKDAQFTINGSTYHLPASEGNNTLHGGIRGFDKVLWTAKEKKWGKYTSIQFTYHSHDGEQGFPGDLDVSATYTLGYNKLRLDMKAVARNKPTPVNLVQHTYWNLAGHNSGRDILGHSVKIWASKYTPTDKALIPTGQILPVKGTPLDFTKEVTVGSKINELPAGYDHNYVLNSKKNSKTGLRPAAQVKEKHSKRMLEVWTNAPGMQFYTSNALNIIGGKGGAVYKEHFGLCLETQNFPNAVNQPNFPSEIVYPGKVYKHTMVFKFSVHK